ncbi:pyruvate carboxylase [Carpediemonas membranifera]|uniref:Acetyl-coenzyme A carboxylase carboxyl transferase subunits beta/alpha n=1 Tax=Carpediemonas membranifera TaxID=201153 RepID=A0A8J6E118_9EUKA|nr:pyruvate carboxylase [Carpediemonas membranifera]|eukprot:KAG9392888.1 pyruvate carboxylase [Carpediemonas membranifera]
MSMFTEVVSSDFLGFEFNNVSYGEQIDANASKGKDFCGITVSEKSFGGVKVIYVTHNFKYFGGTLGCAEGERICRAFDYAREHMMPLVMECASGGARMQEGTLALMQMAKVSCAVAAFRACHLPFITLLLDPTYGGVAASYAMQADFKIGIKDARIGFAGPSVILNTCFDMEQDKYDTNCPEGFQSAQFLHNYGQIDMVALDKEDAHKRVATLIQILARRRDSPFKVEDHTEMLDAPDIADIPPGTPTRPYEADYTHARNIDRYQPTDLVHKLFGATFIHLAGDGRQGRDDAIQGGIGLLPRVGDNTEVRPCVVIATHKGHSAEALSSREFGMSHPDGYRTAQRLMGLADQFGLPVVSLVDTCGALPSFDAEVAGQGQAIAEILLFMASLRTPIYTVVTGEGGSGGALGLAMGNRVSMLSNAYYSVISPEGAASILGRYKDEDDKKTNFPKDCMKIATKQHVYAHQLKELGVIDSIITEYPAEDYHYCPFLLKALSIDIMASFAQWDVMTPDDIVKDRQAKFRAMGRFLELTPTQLSDKLAALEPPAARPSRKGAVTVDLTKDATPGPEVPPNLVYIAERTVADNSRVKKARADQPLPVCPVPVPVDTTKPLHDNTVMTAKRVLDERGPEAAAKWVREQSGVLLTDTTFRDAHQSLLATRVRTKDFLDVVDATQQALATPTMFSFECWGGATFDVAFRFLKESPWARLRELRARIPNACLQMLLRGSNAVGYASYPDNVVREFITQAANNGIDVFRIFDCFNNFTQMEVSIDQVRKVGKIAEVAICFTGNFLDENETKYTLDYYRALAQKAVSAGAHILAIKDMAGLFRPQMAGPLMAAMREVAPDIPIHFHTHNTSSAALAACLGMASAGCDIMDFAISSLADTTSQPSLNAFITSVQGTAMDTGIDYLKLEPIAQYWEAVRKVYASNESGIKTGTARVYEHQIPGGQFSNLYAQARDMGLEHRWSEILDMYRDVNRALGDIVKVTPSSKCVGDLSMYLIMNDLTPDAVNPATVNPDFPWPQSIQDLFEGKLGFPEDGLPDAFSKAVLKDKKPLSERPGKVMPPADLEKIKADLSSRYNIEAAMEDAVSYVMFPAVFEAWMAHIQKYSAATVGLPSHVFFGGMVCGETVGDITLTRFSPVSAHKTRTLSFLVGGISMNVVIAEPEHNDGNKGKAVLPPADKNDPTHITAPMPGKVTEIAAEPGAHVYRGEPLLKVSSLKMDVEITAPHEGVVEKVVASLATPVTSNCLLLVLSQMAE